MNFMRLIIPYMFQFYRAIIGGLRVKRGDCLVYINIWEYHLYLSPFVVELPTLSLIKGFKSKYHYYKIT
jgi:hypothetical protein